MTAPTPVVLCRVGDLTCALPSTHVVETMRAMPAAPLDDMPGFVRGIATIRGAATVVVELAALLGHEARESSRYVTIRTGDRVIALAVDQVIGVSWFDAGDLSARPSLLSTRRHHAVQSLAMKDNQLYLILDAARVIEDVPPVP